MKHALIILAQNGYQDFEEAGTRKGLEDSGFTVTIASSAMGLCHGKLGGTLEASVALKDIQVAQSRRTGRGRRRNLGK